MTASIVGQFPAPEEGEYFSLVLGKDSPLTPCVNKALAAMRDDGTLEAITKEWLADKVTCPGVHPLAAAQLHPRGPQRRPARPG